MTLHPTALTFALAAAVALASPLATAQTAVSAEARVEAGTHADTLRDRTCLRHTGSRIQVRAPTPGNDDSRTSRRDCLAANGRVYTRADIDGTGRTDIGEALRALDPSIR